MEIIIIPACGLASRIGNIPKFLLPIKSDSTLIKNILEIAHDSNFKNIWISTLPKYANMLHEYLHEYAPNIKITYTMTMSETIYQYKHLNLQKTIMVMPDTYINDTKIFSKISDELKESDVVVCVWKINEYQKGKLGQCFIDNNNNVTNVVDKDASCEYPYAWGVLGWNNIFWDYIDPNTSHVGYALNPAIKDGLKIKAIYMDDIYNDCGTFDEYVKLINFISKNKV